MKISRDHYNELLDKKTFVSNLDGVFADPDVKKRTSIFEIEYDVFATKYGIHEYIVITFNGGGKNVRNCEGNSLTAVFREIGKLLNGGYYDELGSYEKLKEIEEEIEVE